jgi:hypothetical protein
MGKNLSPVLAFSDHKIPLPSPFIKEEAPVALALPLFLKEGQGEIKKTVWGFL